MNNKEHNIFTHECSLLNHAVKCMVVLETTQDALLYHPAEFSLGVTRDSCLKTSVLLTSDDLRKFATMLTTAADHYEELQRISESKP